MSSDGPRPDLCEGRYSFVSLGCPKNLVDSERMLGLLQRDGYQLVSDARQADFAVVNTCGFIEAARQESLAAIDEMLTLKRQGALRGVIVAGCLAERQREALRARRPEIDHIMGVFDREEIARVAKRLLAGRPESWTAFRAAPTHPLSDRSRLRITPRHFAFLKISEGCNRRCSFCAIPTMRGRHASKAIAEVLAEARELAASGVRELILVAQDTTYYGIDRYGAPRLAELLRQLDGVEKIRWIRLMYLYPMYFDQGLVDTIAGSAKVVPYLDIPLQHINSGILRRMRRPVDRRATERLLDGLRQSIPRLVLRTTLMTGFPGETDVEFGELLDFVGQQQFERLGVFAYSLEPDTPAAQLPGQVAEDVKRRRRNRLMAAQQQVAFAWSAAQVGHHLDVLIDAQVPDTDGAWIGRSYADAPEIDPVVYVTGTGLRVGQVVPCEIVATQHYDLIAASVGPALD